VTALITRPTTHLATLTLTMVALCAVAHGAETGSDNGVRTVAAEASYKDGLRAKNEGRLPEAVRALEAAVRQDPGNPAYRKALDEATALVGTNPDGRAVTADRYSDELRVRQQQLWVEAVAKTEDAERLIAAGKYLEAQRELQLARTRLESLPFADERREPQLRKVASLAAETKTRRDQQETALATSRAQAALQQQEALRAMGLQLERDRIEAMLARAERARDRRDYDESILLCEQVLRINRADSRASSLLAKSRRERHAYLRQVTADRWDEEHKLLSEQIRAALLPQLEIITYSSDWPEIDAKRSAPTRGLEEGKGETWRKDLDNQLEQEVTLDFQEQDLNEVVSFLQRVTRANIVLDPKVIAAQPPPISLNVNKMRLRYVLDHIVKLSGLTYAMKDEALYISSADGVRGDAFMKIYDIRDLTHAPQSFPGPELDIPQPGGQGAVMLPAIDSENTPETGEFIEIIRKVVSPNTWDAAKGTDIGEFGGNMVITQTADVHKAVEELLRALRNQKGTQIHVRCKFLNVENSALEQIGVDWRNFTGPNPGNGNGTGTQPITVIGSGGAALIPGTEQPVGAYYGDPASQVAAGGIVNNSLPGYAGGRGLTAGVNEGLTMNTQFWQVANNFYASAVINAVEKERKGNIIYEPDITMFNGQQAHLVQMNQQSYIADYDVVQSQYQPVVTVLSYGTVLDVMAIASADKKYVTMTLRPTNAQVRNWRRFGPPIAEGSFAGGNVENSSTAIGQDVFGLGAGLNPMLVPSLVYQSVRTSVTIPDGGSLVIGGMTNADSERVHAGIPFLSHIPFLGRLFSSNGKRETQFQTMIVIQADVVIFEEVEKNL